MPTISCNLQEIYCSIKNKHSNDINLVPSLITDSVYYSGSGWGRLWKWFYFIVEWIGRKDFKTERLRQVMLKTQAVFEETLPTIVDYAKTYQSYLDKRLKGNEVDENEIHESRKKITEWNRSTTPFVDYIQYSENSKISTVFQQFFGDSSEKNAALFSYGEERRILKESQLFIDIEGYLHSPLPISILVKVGKQKELSPKETQEFSRWVETLNYYADQIPIGLFLDCLELLMEKSGEKASLVNLQLRLLQKGLKIFQRPDQDHRIWRGSLIPGDELPGKTGKIILGRKIPERECGFRDNQIFAIENIPDCLVAVGENRAYWPLKKEIGEKHQWGIPMPDVKYIDPKGRFAIIENLTPAIKDNQWTTPPNTQLKPEDRETLTPIANLFRWWKEQSVCPENFSLKHLVFNQSGALKYTHALLPQPFEFRILEDALFKISQGHLNVYKFLMKESGLCEHITMSYYREIVSQALKNKPLDAEKEAISRRITDPVVVEQGNELYQTIQKIKQETINALETKFTFSDEGYKFLHKELNKQLTKWYKGTYSASRIWPTMQPSILNNLERCLKFCKGCTTSG